MHPLRFTLLVFSLAALTLVSVFSLVPGRARAGGVSFVPHIADAGPPGSPVSMAPESVVATSAPATIAPVVAPDIDADPLGHFGTVLKWLMTFLTGFSVLVAALELAAWLLTLASRWWAPLAKPGVAFVLGIVKGEAGALLGALMTKQAITVPIITGGLVVGLLASTVGRDVFAKVSAALGKAPAKS